MTTPVLFSTGATPSNSTSRNLVEFKAGKMEMRERMVHPIKRQGLVYLRQSPDDSLMHFCWKDRQTGVTEDDLILFPDDCEFKRVKECTTGRVYVLKMKSSGKKMFFWMQDPKTDKDDDYCKRINELLNNPPRPGNEGMGNLSERDMSSLFGSMTQEQVAQLLSSNGVNLASLLNATGRSPSTHSGASASSTASTTNSVPNASQVAASNASIPQLGGSQDSNASLNDLRALISGALLEGSGNEDEANALMAATMAQAQAEAVASGGTSARQQSSSHDQQESQLIDLSLTINSDSLAHLMNDEEFLKRIEKYLPPVSGSSSSAITNDERKKQFADTVRSSQFRSSLNQFCVALLSGQLGPLMSQFGLNEACVAAASLGNLAKFAKALEAQMKSSSGQQEPPPSGGSQ